jgi:hypothetical protein
VIVRLLFVVLVAPDSPSVRLDVIGDCPCEGRNLCIADLLPPKDAVRSNTAHHDGTIGSLED